MRRSLERSDALINLRNQEIAALNSRLAAKDETIAELGEQIDRLESELEGRSEETSAPAAGLVEKAPEILSFFKPWLSPKAPKNLFSKLEEFLEMIEGLTP